MWLTASAQLDATQSVNHTHLIMKTNAMSRYPLRLLLLFLLIRLSGANIGVPSLPKITEPLATLQQALERGYALRPYVIEWDEDEVALSPSPERLLSRNDDAAAFGKRVTVDEVTALLQEDAMKDFVSSVASHLLILVEAGYYRLTDEYKLGGTIMTIETSARGIDHHLLVHELLSTVHDHWVSVDRGRGGGRGLVTCRRYHLLFKCVLVRLMRIYMPPLVCCTFAASTFSSVLVTVKLVHLRLRQWTRLLMTTFCITHCRLLHAATAYAPAGAKCDPCRCRRCCRGRWLYQELVPVSGCRVSSSS